MILIGLTGQTGSGKTYLSNYLSKKGYAVIDCDKSARIVTDLSYKNNCLSELSDEFSDIILNSDGSLNRRMLGNIVFADKNKLSNLNKLIFPFIIKEIDEEIEKLKGSDFVILDAPTLFESGIHKMCRVIISVIAAKEKRLERIIKRDGLSLIEAENRINSQQPASFFVQNSDFIIENNGDETQLNEKIEQAEKYILGCVAKWQE